MQLCKQMCLVQKSCYGLMQFFTRTLFSYERSFASEVVLEDRYFYCSVSTYRVLQNYKYPLSIKSKLWTCKSKALVGGCGGRSPPDVDTRFWKFSPIFTPAFCITDLDPYNIWYEPGTMHVSNSLHQQERFCMLLCIVRHDHNDEWKPWFSLEISL